MTQRIQLRLSAACAATLLFAQCAPAGDIQYSVTDLGTLGGNYLFASGLNNHGQVVGYSSTNGTSGIHAFIYTSGTMTDLGTLGGTNSYGWGINDAGQVVGSAYLANGQSHGFIYSNGVMSDLGTFGGTGSDARAINDYGRIAGSAWTANDTELDAFLLANGVKTNLGTLGGERATSYAVNDKGDVAGGSMPPGSTVYYPFLYSGGTMQQLIPTSASGGGYAYGINHNGDVVGWMRTTGSPQTAFLYSNGTITDLGSLGLAGSKALAINNRGQIVGTATTSELGTHAFLYDEGAMVDLNTLIDTNTGWTLEVASSINDYGQIVGVGTHPAATLRAFLLTPARPLLHISLTSSNAIVLQFMAQGNKGYVIEYSDTLQTNDWHVLVVLDPITVPHEVSLTQAITGSAVRFYRVRAT